MTHALAVHRNQSRTRSQAGKPALERCAPSNYHDETSAALSSLALHNLAGGFGPRHFLFQAPDHAFHNLIDALPSHSSVLPRYGSTRTDGVVGSVPFVIGEIRNE